MIVCLSGDTVTEGRNFLLSFHSGSHLRELVFAIGSFICIFRKINMQVLSKLGIVIVCCVKKSNTVNIMLHSVALYEIEVASNVEFDKYAFVIVKTRQCFFQEFKRFIAMYRILCKKNEIQERSRDSY